MCALSWLKRDFSFAQCSRFFFKSLLNRSTKLIDLHSCDEKIVVMNFLTDGPSSPSSMPVHLVEPAVLTAVCSPVCCAKFCFAYTVMKLGKNSSVLWLNMIRWWSIRSMRIQFVDGFLIAKWSFKIEKTKPCYIPMTSRISYTFKHRSAYTVSWIC